MSRRLRPDQSRTNQQPDPSHPTWLPPGRECPWCGSKNTVFVQRGLASGNASRDQYIRCNDCDKLTYDIVAKTDREIRIGQFRNGGIYRDPANQTRYHIYRMLKVGFNEFLLYLRPILPGPEDTE